MKLTSLVFTCALVAACGGDDSDHEDDYQTLQACVGDHVEEGLTETEAITHCLVDYPDLHDEFEDQADCVAFVTANGGYAETREAACEDYFAEHDHDHDA